MDGPLSGRNEKRCWMLKHFFGYFNALETHCDLIFSMRAYFQSSSWIFPILVLSRSCCAPFSGGLVKAGAFQNYAHGIGGEVFIRDEKTLVIKGFTYDGSGPDTFFWAGTSQAPTSEGTILPYPFEGEFYAYEDQSAPILSRGFFGEEIM